MKPLDYLIVIGLFTFLVLAVLGAIGALRKAGPHEPRWVQFLFSAAPEVLFWVLAALWIAWAFQFLSLIIRFIRLQN
jgi:hypothetical protein